VIGVSAISCWEIAKLVEYGRLKLPCPLKEWFEQALSYPGVYLLDWLPRLRSSQPNAGEFHRDPADRLLWRRQGCTAARW